MGEQQKSKGVYLFLFRWLVFIIGLWIVAFSIALMIRANLGVAPWDVLHIGLWLNFGLTIGTWSIIVGLGIVFFTSILTKAWPKMGAFVNMLLLGIFIDLMLLIPWIQTPTTFTGQLIMFLIGLVIHGYGISLYISPNCGAGPRDSLMLALTEKTGWKVQYIRASMEIVVLFCGWFMGGPVFIGTLIFCFGIGSIIGYTLPHCRRLVNRMIGGIQNENINKGKVRINHHDGVSQ